MNPPNSPLQSSPPSSSSSPPAHSPSLWKSATLPAFQADVPSACYAATRFSISGRDPSEVGLLASWVRRWRVGPRRGLVLATQLSRASYSSHRSRGSVASFGHFLRNFWDPLLEAAATLVVDWHGLCARRRRREKMLVEQRTPQAQSPKRRGAAQDKKQEEGSSRSSGVDTADGRAKSDNDDVAWMLQSLRVVAAEEEMVSHPQPSPMEEEAAAAASCWPSFAAPLVGSLGGPRPSQQVAPDGEGTGARMASSAKRAKEQKEEEKEEKKKETAAESEGALSSWPSPDDWTSVECPPIEYFLHFMHVYLGRLNGLLALAHAMHGLGNENEMAERHQQETAHVGGEAKEDGSGDDAVLVTGSKNHPSMRQLSPSSRNPEGTASRDPDERLPISFFGEQFRPIALWPCSGLGHSDRRNCGGSDATALLEAEHEAAAAATTTQEPQEEVTDNTDATLDPPSGRRRRRRRRYVPLASAWLYGDGVRCHGRHLTDAGEGAVFVYLFYLAQVPLALCPTSDASSSPLPPRLPPSFSGALQLPPSSSPSLGSAAEVRSARGSVQKEVGREALGALLCAVPPSRQRRARYRDHPFPALLRRGLAVSLGTHCPRAFHSTPTPLLEEFVTAKHAFDLSDWDMCEAARSSCVAFFSMKEISALYGGGTFSSDGDTRDLLSRAGGVVVAGSPRQQSAAVASR